MQAGALICTMGLIRLDPRLRGDDGMRQYNGAGPAFGWRSCAQDTVIPGSTQWRPGIQGDGFQRSRSGLACAGMTA